ncbi:MAG: DUF4124 domain-containing protein [Hydrogenophaga sp.]|nr:DUF4124 domain-containing protein [Hydrogenophaga sp.]
MRSIAIAALLLIAVHPGAWAVYKCTSPDGRVAFQETPCAQGGEKLKIQPLGGTDNKSKLPTLEDLKKVLEQKTTIPTSAIPQRSEEELRQQVIASLKDPQSAQFRAVRHVGEGKAICGEVNARNSYGGFAGFRAFVADAQGVYWHQDGSGPSSIGFDGARNMYYPRAHAWGCL